jgi:outer membrane protein insertion porin family
LRPGESISGNSAKPRVSVGFGLTMKTPGGTMRLDYARPIASQPGDRPRSFSVTFGAAI